MEKMSARKGRKLVERVGNHDPYWMSYVSRVAQAAALWLRVRDLLKMARENAADADAEWEKLERHLQNFSMHMIHKLRDHTTPALFRQMDDVTDWVTRPQDLSSNPLCWALLGSLEATTILLGSMKAARSIYGANTLRAAVSLSSQLNTYQTKVFHAYEEVRSLMALICEDALPKSVELVIHEVESGPILMVRYEPNPQRDFE